MCKRKSIHNFVSLVSKPTYGVCELITYMLTLIMCRVERVTMQNAIINDHTINIQNVA